MNYFKFKWIAIVLFVFVLYATTITAVMYHPSVYQTTEEDVAISGIEKAIIEFWIRWLKLREPESAPGGGGGGAG